MSSDRDRDGAAALPRRADLAGLVHWIVMEWMAAPESEDWAFGHPIVLEDGTLSPEGAECAQCRSTFEAIVRGEPVGWPDTTLATPMGDAAWRCPLHGRATIKARAGGLVYRGCPDCTARARWVPDDPEPLSTAEIERVVRVLEQSRKAASVEPEWRPQPKPAGAVAMVAAGVHLHGPGRCDYSERGRCVYPGIPRLAFADGDRLPSPKRPKVLLRSAAVAAAVAAGIHIHGGEDCAYGDLGDRCVRPGLHPLSFEDFR